MFINYKFFLGLMFAFFLAGNVFQASSSGFQESAFGEVLFVSPTPLIQLKFPYNLLHSDYVNTSTTGTASVGTVSTNLAQMQATAATSSAMLVSRNRLNYQPGQGSVIMASAIFTPGVANSTQLIGGGNFTTNTNPTFADIADGFFFGYSGAKFGIFQYNNSVVTFTPQTAWNYDTMDGFGQSKMILDPTKGNVYKIQCQWLGFGYIRFFIEDAATGNFQLVHAIRYPNNNLVPSLLNPDLRLLAGVSNAANATTITLKTPCMNGVVEGSANIGIDVRNSISNNKAINTTIVNVLTIQNNTTFNAITNNAMVYLENITIFNLGVTANHMICSVYLNPTVGGVPSFTNINAATSVVSYDVAGTTITSPPGKALWTFYLAGGNKATVIDLLPYNFNLVPGDRLVVACRTVAGTGTGYVSLGWRERI